MEGRGCQCEAGGKGRNWARVRPKAEEKFAMMPDAILFLIKQVGVDRPVAHVLES